MPLALILIDALSAIYPASGQLPVLDAFATDGFATPLDNLYAYRGIEATLFSGQTLAQHGVWGEFRPAPPPPPQHWRERVARLVIEAGDTLPSDRLRLDVRYVAAKFLDPGQHLPTGNLIPAALMPHFTASIERPIWEPEALGHHNLTLFDELRAAGRTFATAVYPQVRCDSEVVEVVRARLRRLDQPRPDFWYIKFSALDALGHHYGPDPRQLAPALHELNHQLETLLAVLRAEYYLDDIEIAIVGDHGMSHVNQLLDVRPTLNAIPYRAGQDYLYFLDSTTLRFWSQAPPVLNAIRQHIGALPRVHELNPATRRILALPTDTSIGDVLFALEEGTVVFPDFFRRQTPPAGMHGYAQVRTEAGLPYLAVSSEIAAALPHTLPTCTHAMLWAAMRQRLNIDPQPAALPLAWVQAAV